MSEKQFVHPYIPNSEPKIKAGLLKALNMTSVEDIYKEIPDRLRFKGEMNLPAAINSEFKLKRHIQKLLSKNENCTKNTSFLGGGVWNHYVPSVCDTIMGRDEFLTAYVGEAYSDHGKFQALFETSSMICDLTGMGACNTPTYDWSNAIAIAARMACRASGRNEILMARNAGPERVELVKNYVKPDIALNFIEFDAGNGLLNLKDLKAKISTKTAAIYFENPCYIGTIETQAPEICRLAKEAGAFVIVGVDPSSLGILEAPGNYGADFVVGDYQPLGQHMSYAGTLGGFVCTHDEKKFVGEYPSLLFGICETSVEGEYGFGEVFYERTSYASREKGKDFIGTCSALTGIVSGVYMALMGPQGFEELGKGILQRVAYTKERLAEIPGVSIPMKAVSYCDFMVNFDKTGKTVKQINKGLLAYNIFGGKDISREFPVYGQSALYSITEVHSKEEIDNFLCALEKVCTR